MKYNFLKLIHIAALITWLGPGTGGYYLLILSQQSGEYEVEMWLRNFYLSLIHVEVAGLLLLFVSGLGMLIASQRTLLKQRWLQMKIAIVFSVFYSP